MDTKLENLILKQTNSSKILVWKTIQSLWSGYGELVRVKTDKASFVVKIINTKKAGEHPRGWNNKLGHQRKKKSYAVESNWYSSYNRESFSLAYPQQIYSGEINDLKLIILEDLAMKGFSPKDSVNKIEVEQALKWLANFHKHFMGCKPNGLWSVGTYWHLETRPDELQEMKDEELKLAAPMIDKLLNEATYHTIVHGDAKLANFLFNGTMAAAVDFQYVGGGVGVKDLAYFLSSIFDEDQLLREEQYALDTYFHFLNLPKVEKEWRSLYPVAWCDFYRFLDGWSPGHYKMHAYSKKLRDETLRLL